MIEIRDELIADALSDGALGLVKTQIQNIIVGMTGMMTGPDGAPVPAPPPTPVDVDGDMVPDMMTGPGMPPPTPEAAMAEQAIRERLVTLAYGTKTPQQSVVKPDA